MIKDEMVCEDIVQNVFLKFYENLNKIENKNSYEFWLFKTARNEVYYFFRKKKVKVDQFFVEDTDELEIESNQNLNEEIELKEVKDILKTKLDELPFDQKEIFVLKEYGKLSYKEISRIMEIDEELVKSRLYKTRQKLIKTMSKILK